MCNKTFAAKTEKKHNCYSSLRTEKEKHSDNYFKSIMKKLKSFKSNFFFGRGDDLQIHFLNEYITFPPSLRKIWDQGGGKNVQIPV